MTRETSDAARLGFIERHARLQSPPLTPEIRLWLAAEATPLWEATETFLEAEGLPPPFWAFAWAGGQALARYILDNPELARGQRVADFGAGGGIVAIALPHLIGAPQPESIGGNVPPELAAHFVAASLVTAAIFWCATGWLAGTFWERFSSREA